MEPKDLRVTNRAVKRVKGPEEGSNVGWRITGQTAAATLRWYRPSPGTAMTPAPFVHRVNRVVANTPGGASRSYGRNHISDRQRGVTTPGQSAIVSLQP